MNGSIRFISILILVSASALAAAQTAPGQGQFGSGYDHMNSGNAFGQPGADCEQLALDNPDITVTPGNSGSASGGGSPFTGEDSTGGSHYAGSQPQNSRNSASVSQYDVACANQIR
jgi:hypothetical protein